LPVDGVALSRLPAGALRPARPGGEPVPTAGEEVADLIDRTGLTPAVNQIETHPYFQRQADAR
jgi:hypothetical protein